MSVFDFTPIKFYPYPSIVYPIIHKQICDDDIESIVYQKLRKDLVDIFNTFGIKATIDNKIVFEVAKGHIITNVFIGFYDWSIHLGSGVRKLK